MPRHEEIALAAGQWVQLTNADATPWADGATWDDTVNWSI